MFISLVSNVVVNESGNQSAIASNVVKRTARKTMKKSQYQYIELKMVSQFKEEELYDGELQLCSIATVHIGNSNTLKIISEQTKSLDHSEDALSTSIIKVEARGKLPTSHTLSFEGPK